MWPYYDNVNHSSPYATWDQESPKRYAPTILKMDHYYIYHIVAFINNWCGKLNYRAYMICLVHPALEGPTWMEIHWNSNWLTARSHVTSHYNWGSVTTLHDFGGVLGRPLDTFLLGSHKFMITAFSSCVKWPWVVSRTVTNGSIWNFELCKCTIKRYMALVLWAFRMPLIVLGLWTGLGIVTNMSSHLPFNQLTTACNRGVFV